MKLKAYHLDEKETTARFYPTKTGWKKNLRSIDYFYAPCFISEGLCFRGMVSLERFLEAMHHTLQDFDFLFFQLYRSERGLYASSLAEDNNIPFIQLEIEEKEEPINESTLISILPRKIDERIRGVITDQFEDLPLITFKLTIFIDGFTIGCYWNHAFLDQSSLVYFFKYLSQIYSYGRDHISLKKPKLVDTDFLTLSVKTPKVFKNIKDFRKNSEAFMGFKYTPPKTDNSPPSKTDEAKLTLKSEAYLTVELNFNISEINKLRDTVKQYLSINDIIHAILLKIYSFKLDLPLEKNFCFGFACNMRKYCDFGEEAIGNILSHPLMLLKLQDIKNKKILELALFNRQRLSEINSVFLKKSLVWYRQLQKHHENPLHYMSTLNILNARVTNWSTFNYDGILFDGMAPIELKAPNLAPFRINVISFDNKESKKILKTTIGVPMDGLESLKKLEHDTRLFVSHCQLQIESKEIMTNKDVDVAKSKPSSTRATSSLYQRPHSEQPEDMINSVESEFRPKNL